MYICIEIYIKISANANSNLGASTLGNHYITTKPRVSSSIRLYSATAILNIKWKAHHMTRKKHLLNNDSLLNKRLHAQLRNQRSYHGGLERELGSGMAFWWQKISGSNMMDVGPDLKLVDYCYGHSFDILNTLKLLLET